MRKPVLALTWVALVTGCTMASAIDFEAHPKAKASFFRSVASAIGDCESRGFTRGTLNMAVCLEEYGIVSNPVTHEPNIFRQYPEHADNMETWLQTHLP